MQCLLAAQAALYLSQGCGVLGAFGVPPTDVPWFQTSYQTAVVECLTTSWIELHQIGHKNHWGNMQVTFRDKLLPVGEEEDNCTGAFDLLPWIFPLYLEYFTFCPYYPWSISPTTDIDKAPSTKQKKRPIKTLQKRVKNLTWIGLFFSFTKQTN